MQFVDINALTRTILAKITTLKYYDPKTAQNLLKHYYNTQNNIIKLIKLNELLDNHIERHKTILIHPTPQGG